MSLRPQVRSRNGCFTCRRRKKKCDESAYPHCKNCTSNKLQCSWPDHVVSTHERKQNEERQYLDVFSDASASLAFSTEPETTAVPDRFNARDKGIMKPERRGKNYILQRISMQQDCVEDLQDDTLALLDPLGPSMAIYKAAPASSIRDRIARQMDIPGEEIKKNLYESHTGSK